MKGLLDEMAEIKGLVSDLTVEVKALIKELQAMKPSIHETEAMILKGGLPLKERP